MVDVEFRVLGRLEVYHDGEYVDTGTPKQRVALAALLLNANETVSAERLIESVWWSPPTAAASNLRMYLAGIRRALRQRGEPGTRLQTMRAGGYQLAVEPGELDLHRLGGLAAEAEAAHRAGDFAAAADGFEQALGLFRGRVLDGMSFGPALQPTVMLLEERRISLAERYAKLRLDLGQPESTVGLLRALVSEHPIRERLWGQLMLALCRSGLPGEALAAYARLRTILVEELGTDPGPELRRLHERILHDDSTLVDQAGEVAAGTHRPGRSADAARPPLSAKPAPRLTHPRQLPAGASDLCGRAAELARLWQLLTDGGTGPVVVAIDGVPGVGKSSLALYAAHQCASRFPDGQFYVDLQGATPGLAPLRPLQVLQRLLNTLGVRPSDAPSDEAEAAALFRSMVASRRVLLVLDNADSAAQVRPLLPGGSGCAALVTSRLLLAGLGEAVRVPLGLLTAADSVALLSLLCGQERVTADPEATRRLAELCGNLPLALRIAGARLAARPNWPIAALADRMETAQHRLDELAVADLTVRASLESTYQGLAEHTRLAFRRIGLLRARDFSVWAAAALLDTSLTQAERVLEDLITVHFVETVETCGSTQPRYHLHDLIRLYAQELATETESPNVRAEASHRLLGACLTLAECANVRMSADFLGTVQHRPARWSPPAEDVEKLTADPKAWFEHEYAFLLAAIDDGIELEDTELGCGLAAELTTCFRLGNHFGDWRRVQERALWAARSVGDRWAALKLHRGLGELNTLQDRYSEAIAHFEAARRSRSEMDPGYQAAIASGLGYLYRLRGQYGPALQNYNSAKNLATRTGNLNGLAYATSGIGVIHLERDRLAEANECFETCLRLSRRSGYLPGEAGALRCFGHVQRRLGNYDRAADYFAAAKQISEEAGDRLDAAHAACWLGEMRVRQGDVGTGRRLIAESLWTQRVLDNAWGEAAALWALAVAQLTADRADLAHRRAGQAVAIWRRLGSPHWLSVGLGTLAETYDALGDHTSSQRTRGEAGRLRRKLGRGCDDEPHQGIG